ncbi:MAG TPA: ABC transporter permease [Verrucomicrobiae bacterium]|jgi:ABC-2 type transport system permease protein|nr:ABC transporter permease [Verrucomicrobiae bacterium]
MQAYLTLTRRELATFFLSITGYVIIAGLALLVGLDFVTLLNSVGTDPVSMPITQLFFNNLLLWIIIVLTAPVITMRLFALEKATGTFETLTTTPVGEVQIVAAKFTASVIFFVVMWLPTLACMFIVQHFANQPGALEKGTLCSMYLGLLLAGCFILSIGCFASALTKNQVVAGMLTLVAGMALLMLNWLAQNISPGGRWPAQVLSFFNLSQQMIDFTRGILDTRVIVFYLSVTFFFLFLTLRVIESRRWK